MSRYSRIKYYHQQMIALFGEDSSLAQGWREHSDQQIRFEVLSQIGNLNEHSVLDAGCGYADLYPFLKERYPRLQYYYGIEQLSQLADKAKWQYRTHTDVHIEQGDFMKNLPLCDYVLASGSLNYGSKKNDFIFKAIKQLYDSCNIALGFNLLRSVKGTGILAVYDPELILEFAHTLSTNVRLIDNYVSEDYTVFIYK